MEKVSRQQMLDFINDENNKDFLEQAWLYSEKMYGWHTLSSGKTVYISTPISGAEAGKAMKSILLRMNEIGGN